MAVAHRYLDDLLVYIRDSDLVMCVAEVYKTYNDRIDVVGKAKSLLKFGENNDLDTGSWETVWQNGGEEIYVTDNLIDTISSGNAGDTQVIRIEGHTVTGTGTDAQFTFVVQTATLNGQNKVTLSTPLARVSRATNETSTSLLGDVHIYEDTALTAGVPTDLTKSHIIIRGTSGYDQSFKAATTFSNSDYFLMTNFVCTVGRTTAATVDFEVQIRSVGGLFRPIERITVNSVAQATQQVFFKPYIIVPKNADIRIVAASSANNTEVDASFQGYIAQVIT